jgi:hypothetical protein
MLAGTREGEDLMTSAGLTPNQVIIIIIIATMIMMMVKVLMVMILIMIMMTMMMTGVIGLLDAGGN